MTSGRWDLLLVFSLVTSLGLVQLRISEIGRENEREIGVGNGSGRMTFSQTSWKIVPSVRPCIREYTRAVDGCTYIQYIRHTGSNSESAASYEP